MGFDLEGNLIMKLNIIMELFNYEMLQQKPHCCAITNHQNQEWGAHFLARLHRGSCPGTSSIFIARSIQASRSFSNCCLWWGAGTEQRQLNMMRGKERTLWALPPLLRKGQIKVKGAALMPKLSSISESFAAIEMFPKYRLCLHIRMLQITHLGISEQSLPPPPQAAR